MSKLEQLSSVCIMKKRSESKKHCIANKEQHNIIQDISVYGKIRKSKNGRCLIQWKPCMTVNYEKHKQLIQRYQNHVKHAYQSEDGFYIIIWKSTWKKHIFAFQV